MKTVVFLGDGMADWPQEIFGDKTPLDVAIHPWMDLIAAKGCFGITYTIPKNMSPGSDVGNLSVFGIDPQKYYTGRSPLEALSLNIPLEATDVTYRCNLVTIVDDGGPTMFDYSAGEISSEEAKAFIKILNDHFQNTNLRFYDGISYRHCLVIKNAEIGCVTTPPHDIMGKKINDITLPKGINSDLLREITDFSIEAFKDHPINLSRIAKGENPVSAAWLWGEGRKPALSSFKEMYGLSGAVISAVDLIFGIGIGLGLQTIKVDGATGNYKTNFSGKGQAAINALKNGADFVYIHCEAPDECSHQNQPKEKIYSIEQIDEKIIAPVMEYLYSQTENWSVLLMPDHYTPVAIRTHTSEPVPFAFMRSCDKEKTGKELRYTESDAAKTKVIVDKAHTLMGMLVK